MKKKLFDFFRTAKGVSVTLLIFAVSVILVFFCLNSAGNSITREQADMLRSSLYSAAVNCYAFTGRYPTLSELKSDYGIIIDENSFFVTYSAFASNVMPDIDVQVIREAD